MDPISPWYFTGPDGAFHLDNPQRTSYLYFPLVNEAGMMSVVTPDLHGDAKAGQHTYLLPPVSVEDLHTSRAARSFWVWVEGRGPWAAAGGSATQTASPDEDQVSLEAGFLWHRLLRSNPRIGLQAETTSIVPPTSGRVELMKVTLTNISGGPLAFTPTAAIPLYGRSADNLRDHRHVTSLLHRVRCGQNGVLVRPVLSFDERGHQPNAVTYAVLGAEGGGAAPLGFFPTVEDFVGEGGSLDWPAAVVRPQQAGPMALSGASVDGYEAMGALRFRDVVLAAGGSCSYVLILGILLPEDGKGADWGEASLVDTYASASRFDALFARNQAYWQARISNLSVSSADPQFDRWLKWVTVQPTLRRLFGNSFLPYHDYGRGGRGWRDLWQDLLALMLLETVPAAAEMAGLDELLFSNFAGVRLDGSNATIIGSRPGEFKADRNNIPRVWMDHGLWPLLSTRQYIDHTGDLAFVLRPQVYFKDGHTHRCRAVDPAWTPSQGTVQHTAGGEICRGSILEHFLVQHLTAFFNVGEHNNILLEDADWNDGMDMARQRGESVAFTAFYASNLRLLSQIVLDLARLGVAEVDLLEELLPLLDTLYNPVAYDSPAAKQTRLEEYFNAVGGATFGGRRRARIPLTDLAADLDAKADWMYAHLQANEWIQSKTGYGWFNGYYDNDGRPLEGDTPGGVRMTLTGQVFPLMGGIATAEQARQVVRAARAFLFDPKVGGYRLNTDFGEVLLNMGRCFGYAYGHKENGAMFSHMAVMYAYALYERGFGREGFTALDCIYRQCVDFTASRMYPGIPEYFSQRGRGMYPYLTGSASWYLLTLLTKAFGVRGLRGDLVLAPMLVSEQFDQAGEAAVTTLFAGRTLAVIYHNPQRLDCGAYRIRSIRLDGNPLAVEPGLQVLLPRPSISGLAAGEPHRLDIELA